jgi:hypothetical protein
MKDEKVIHYDSPEAATYKTDISGWVGADGRFYGKDERAARWGGCTHKKCVECENYTEKTWTHCEDCRNKKAADRYNELPFREWDGKAPLCIWGSEQYFFTEDDLIEYLYDNELNGCDVQLVLARPIGYSEIDYSYWGDDAHEDWEPPKELVEAVEKVNDLIRELKPHSYTIGKIRTSYDYTYKS